MVQSEALAEAKNMLNITTTTYDTDLVTDLTYAIKDLFPLAVKQLTPITAITLNSDMRSFAVPATFDIVSRVEIDGFKLDFTVFAGTVYVNDSLSSGSEIKVYGCARYTLADIANIPTELESVVLNWTVAKFYAALAGNKRKYNSYIGTQGSAADRDIKDSADYFKLLGDDLLADRIPVRGY